MANLTPFYVYILECSDGSYYVGLTSDIERRVVEHNQGVYDSYTSRRRPVKLLWTDTFPDYDQAFAVERQVKKWSRAKKEALMSGDFELLSRISREAKGADHRSHTSTSSV